MVPSIRYKKCSSNPVASTFNFFFVAVLFFSSPFCQRQQLFVTVSSSFLSFSFSFYLLLSLFYPTLFISLPSCTPCFKKLVKVYGLPTKKLRTNQRVYVVCQPSRWQILIKLLIVSFDLIFFFHSQISS